MEDTPKQLTNEELEIKFVPAPALPEITNIRRYRYRPGDRIVVRINDRVDDYMGVHVRKVVALVLGVPDSSVLVLSQGSDIKVLRNASANE